MICFDILCICNDLVEIYVIEMTNWVRCDENKITKNEKMKGNTSQNC